MKKDILEKVAISALKKSQAARKASFMADKHSNIANNIDKVRERLKTKETTVPRHLTPALVDRRLDKLKEKHLNIAGRKHGQMKTFNLGTTKNSPWGYHSSTSQGTPMKQSFI